MAIGVIDLLIVGDLVRVTETVTDFVNGCVVAIPEVLTV